MIVFATVTLRYFVCDIR